MYNMAQGKLFKVEIIAVLPCELNMVMQIALFELLVPKAYI